MLVPVALRKFIKVNLKNKINNNNNHHNRNRNRNRNNNDNDDDHNNNLTDNYFLSVITCCTLYKGLLKCLA